MRGISSFGFAATLVACTPTHHPVEPAPAPPPTAPMVSASPEPAPIPAPAVVEEPSSRAKLPVVAPCRRSAVVMVIDRSGSMSGLPIEKTKEALNATLKNLDERDCYGVILFDSKPTRLVPLAPLADKESVKKRIASIDAGGGTEIFSALETAAREILAAETAPRRGIVLLTDGQSPSKGVRELTQRLAREQVSVNPVGLGHGVDEGMLRMIADEGHGHLTLVRDAEKLPPLLTDEVARIVGP